MSRPGFADRNKLRDWADTTQSQSDFPRLIRRLILETTPGLVELGMPAAEGVAAGKWDGWVRAASSNAWVPDGLSVWELSVNSGAKAKAEQDYRKRDSTPDGSPLDECTYVQAILRVWTDRETFAKTHSAEKKWKEVRAYGLDDIHAWLEAAPITWAWFSEALGLNPYGMRTAETWWEAWSQQTNPVMTPAVLLAGRDDSKKAIRDRMARPGVTTVEGAAYEETCAFIASLAVDSESDGDGSLLARLAYVNELSTWRLLLDSAQPPILVPLDPEFAREVPSGSPHAVLVPVVGTGVADVELPDLDASAVTAALRAAGMTDEKESDDAGRLARRSLTALRRHLATNKALHRPPWAEPPVGRYVRAALLAGRWNDHNDGDRFALAELAGEPYNEFRERAAALTASSDPMLLNGGTSWDLVAPYDSWLLLNDRLTHDDLNRFQLVVNTVIGEIDPSLDVPEDVRWWKASIEGKVRAFSADLRRGLARSLALLGVHGASLSAPGSATGSDWANYLVRSLLKNANEDSSGRTWASLSDVLPLLAEAGPDAFVDEVTRGVAGDGPVLHKLFTDQNTDGLFSASSPHTGLLWALETVAWSPDHFGAAVDLLARLDEIDPGGRLGNRPFASLASVFCPWHPENSVTVERRLKVVDSVRKRHNGVAWKLLLSMLPEFHGVHFPTNAPHFRDWKPRSVPVTNVEYLDFVSNVVARCIEEASTDGERWSEFLNHYSDLPPSDRTVSVNALTALVESDQLPDAARDLLWNAIRDLVGKHRQYPDAKWALAEDDLLGLEVLIEPLTPKDPSQRHAWLFQDHMPHLEGAKIRDDHDAYEALLAEERAVAVGEIVAEGGLDAVRTLVRKAKVSWSVGIALADAVPEFDDELFVDLRSDDRYDIELAMQYFARRFRQGGRSWLDSVLSKHSDGTAAQRARLLLAARDLPKDWEAAEAEGAEVTEFYWKHFVPDGLGSDFDNVVFVANQLMKYGRNAIAIELLVMHLRRDTDDEIKTAELIANGLEGLLGSIEDPELSRLSAYSYGQAFALLERHRDLLGVDRIARLEWAFLPALGYKPQVPALHEGMAQNPEFFVEVVCAVYRSRKIEDAAAADEEAGEQQEGRARNAYHLLSSWSVMPGLVDGKIDQDRLRAWLDGARRLLDERGRLEVGLVHFGHVLASAPPDDDGAWPPEVVRDLLEELQSEDVEGGLSAELFNSRRVTSRGLEEGGVQEMELAAKYRADADRWADEWPRIAALLRGIAKSYEADARRNEDSAERFRRGLE
ncbi:MAG: hypothetical protein KatS3mg009_0510 [Acidimicrobiia bacterium]|nr:MAG: hypothetical protein KatS3mg009_0510 [Acidimicrobiia bacterium]